MQTLTRRLRETADDLDAAPRWPEGALRILAEGGAWRWNIPAAFGGDGLGPAEQILGYEAVARGCVTAALILTQRDGACDLIARSANTAVAERLLPEHARGARFTSVGISQLTTSKGPGGAPLMAAAPAGDGYVLDGTMPWVTGAAHCDELVTGGILPDGRQVLCLVPVAAGVQVGEPMRLLALEASLTARVRCEHVVVPAVHVLAGPVEVALKHRAPVKPLVVSSVGLGLAGALLDEIVAHADGVPADVAAPLERLRDEYGDLRAQLLAAGQLVARDPQAEPPAAALRVRINTLLHRLAAAALITGKGRAFVRPSTTERLAREALFFHVWSAPDPVRAGTLAALAPPGD